MGLYDSIGSFGQPQQPTLFNGVSADQPSNYGGIFGLSATPSWPTDGLAVPGKPPGAGAGDGASWFGRDGYLSTGIQGLQALSGAYLGFKQLAQAKDALNFQKKAYNTNLTNSVQTYNNSLQDRINGRTADYAGKEGDVQAYLASHELKKPGG